MMKVYYTTYDGYYVVVEGKETCAYEGIKLCPNKVKKWLEQKEPIEIHDFHMDAIAYGKCK